MVRGSHWDSESTEEAEILNHSHRPELPVRPMAHEVIEVEHEGTKKILLESQKFYLCESNQSSQMFQILIVSLA